MARLVTLHAGQARLPLEIPLAAMVLVGSSPDCDLCIDSPAVSRRHCRIVFRGDAWVVEDLGSTNGVHVNDVAVTTTVLRNADFLRIGDVIFRVDIPGVSPYH